ncbi:MAG: hypothetical protein F4Z04_11315 [Acidobacteria bacterium]|nr:hypothetical protein [Acidobacteriota bacterium]
MIWKPDGGELRKGRKSDAQDEQVDGMGRTAGGAAGRSRHAGGAAGAGAARSRRRRRHFGRERSSGELQ